MLSSLYYWIMPKKTKKQKILAQLHRKINTVSSTSAQFVKSQNHFEPKEKLENKPASYTYHNSSITTTKTSAITLDYFHIKSDLIKILIFTLFALISQGVLYFFLRTR